MTKEELEKEAYEESEKLKEYQTKPSNEYEKGFNNGEVRGYKDGYRDGTEPREKRIAELLKENAELRKDKEELCHSISEGGKACVYLNEHLTKAKEIIKELMSFSVQLCDCRHTVDFEKVRAEAEQFLKDQEEEPCGQ